MKDNLKKYIIFLNEVKIGTTHFELADTPMGVVQGKIFFENIISPYELFKNHCQNYKVKINDYDANLKIIDTVIIPELKVIKEDGLKLEGWGGAITGMDNVEYEIQFYGISSELMKTEFIHHYIEYYGEDYL